MYELIHEEFDGPFIFAVRKADIFVTHRNFDESEVIIITMSNADFRYCKKMEIVYPGVGLRDKYNLDKETSEELFEDIFEDTLEWEDE